MKIENVGAAKNLYGYERQVYNICLHLCFFFFTFYFSPPLHCFRALGPFTIGACPCVGDEIPEYYHCIWINFMVELWRVENPSLFFVFLTSSPSHLRTWKLAARKAFMATLRWWMPLRATHPTMHSMDMVEKISFLIHIYYKYSFLRKMIVCARPHWWMCSFRRVNSPNYWQESIKPLLSSRRLGSMNGEWGSGNGGGRLTSKFSVYWREYLRNEALMTMVAGVRSDGRWTCTHSPAAYYHIIIPACWMLNYECRAAYCI